MISNDYSHMVPIRNDVAGLWLAIDNHEWTNLENLGISEVLRQWVFAFGVHLRQSDSIHLQDISNKDIAFVGARSYLSVQASKPRGSPISGAIER